MASVIIKADAILVSPSARATAAVPSRKIARLYCFHTETPARFILFLFEASPMTTITNMSAIVICEGRLAEGTPIPKTNLAGMQAA